MINQRNWIRAVIPVITDVLRDVTDELMIEVAEELTGEKYERKVKKECVFSLSGHVIYTCTLQ